MKDELLKKIKSQAHNLKPVIIIGAKGVTPKLLAEVESSLLAHELIKVKLPQIEKALRITLIEEVTISTQAKFIQLLGRIATIYRKNTEV